MCLRKDCNRQADFVASNRQSKGIVSSQIDLSPSLKVRSAARFGNCEPCGGILVRSKVSLRQFPRYYGSHLPINQSSTFSLLASVCVSLTQLEEFSALHQEMIKKKKHLSNNP